MATYSHSIGGQTWRFDSLREVLAKASPLRSGDCLAGVAATSDAERAAAQMTLADVPLKQFLLEAVIPYERDEVTRLIIDSHDASAFAPVSHLTVGGLRDWLLGDHADEASLRALAPGLTPEMAATTSNVPFAAMLTGAQGAGSFSSLLGEAKGLNALVAASLAVLWALRRGH